MISWLEGKYHGDAHHDHDHGQAIPSDLTLRVKALESLLGFNSRQVPEREQLSSGRTYRV
jgi:hypothetical protein